MSKAKTEENPLATCKPRGDRALVKRDQRPKQTAGGIHIPDVARADKKNKQQFGTVLAVGPKVEGLAAGDRVVIPAFAGIEVQDDQEYILVRDEDIVAVL